MIDKRANFLRLFFVCFLGSGVLFYAVLSRESNLVKAAGTAAVETSVTISVCGNNIKEANEQCDGSDFGAASCLSLGYSGGTIGCSSACERQVSSCVSAAPMASTTLMFYPSNGGNATLTNSDNTTVVFIFPANFYSEGVRLQANSYANNFFASEKPTLSGKSFIGKTYDFSISATSTGSQISTISAAATLTISYSDSDVSGIDENTLVPYRWGSSDTSWQLISGAVIDTVNNKVTFSTAHFSSFAIFGSPPAQQQQQQQQSSGGGGGGGGGGYYVAPVVTSVVFFGRAYPKSAVTLLKDAQIAATTIVGADANFQMSISGLAAGNYIFSIYGEDKDGKRSSLLIFPVSVTAGATTNVRGIFIAPTIAVDKAEVKRGDNLTIFGQSAPQADIVIVVSSDEEFFSKTISDKDGIYLYNFDTAILDYGTHHTKSKASIGNQLVSNWSHLVSFKVGAKTVKTEKPEEAPAKGDLNNDKRVNLVDFSIEAYWYKRPSPPVFNDFNGDGKVDLTDFSIMAFYWTG